MSPSIFVFLLISLAWGASALSAREAAIYNYWESQEVGGGGNYSLFFDALAENAYFTNTFSGFPAAVGKAAIVALVSSINTPAAGFYVRKIHGIRVFEDVGKGMVGSEANKTICGFQSGECGKRLTYGLHAKFNSGGKIESLREFVHSNAIQYILPEGFPDGQSPNAVSGLCSTIGALCAGVPISYGTLGSGVPRTCYQHWLGAPTYPFQRYVIERTGYATTCAILAVGEIASGASPSAVCPKFGIPVSGINGCWN